MYTLPEVRGARPGIDQSGAATAPLPLDAAVAASDVPGRFRSAYRRLATLDVRWRYPLTIFALTRVLYLVIAIVDTFVRRDAYGTHWSLGSETANWDGMWYLALAAHGYPAYVAHTQTTLGFFPLYPLLMWAAGHALDIGFVWSGLLVSVLTGAVATVLVGRLAERWWNEAASRRAILFFCLFPGSIVFSMDYTEGLLLMLVAGCFLAIEHRRWLLAGILAGISTAVGPVALAIIPACAAAAGLEIYRRGWHDREARRALLAPLLSPAGLLGLALFMWRWTGNPLANYQSQRYAWKETTTPLALYRVAKSLIQEILGVAKYHPNVNLNLVAALLGTAFLVWGLIHLWRGRSRVPIAALVWTAAIVFMTVTSNATPPNARMLLCAFPVLLVIAADLQGRSFRRLIWSSSGLLVIMSVLTFVSTSLRP